MIGKTPIPIQEGFVSDFVSNSLVPEYIEKLIPYKAGKPIDEVKRELGLERVYKLASNENPLGPSPRALEALRAAMADLHLYPDSSGYKLRNALAERYRVKQENVILGSGSEGIMSTIVRTFLHGDEEALTSEGTFVGFMVLARAQGIPLVTVPLSNYGYDLEAMAQAITPKTKVVYLANPNNPTGTIFTRPAFEAFLERVPPHVLILLDEAYFEFVGDLYDYPDSQLYRADNVITLRTFSKSYGLGGIRIGYGLAHEKLIHQLMKVKLPFEPSSLAQAAGLGALEDDDFLQRTLELNQRGLERFYQAFDAARIPYVKSYTNFVMLDLGSEEKVDRLTEGLLRDGIIVRPLKGFGLPHCLRVSVGLDHENEAFLEAFLKRF